MTSRMNNQIPSSRQAVVSGVDFTMVPSWYRFLVNLAQDGASQPPTGPAGGRLDGTYPDPTLKNTGVSPGTYGSPTTVPSFTVASDGTISFASNTTTGVTPGTYGDSTHAPQITVQLDGRLSGAGTVAIVGGTDKQVQFNNGGVLAGNSALLWDSGTTTLVLVGANISCTGAGTQVGTSGSQKLAFWGQTPTTQQTTGVGAATFTANTSGIVDDSATWNGYTIGQIVQALQNIGILA